MQPTIAFVHDSPHSIHTGPAQIDSRRRNRSLCVIIAGGSEYAPYPARSSWHRPPGCVRLQRHIAAAHLVIFFVSFPAVIAAVAHICSSKESVAEASRHLKSSVVSADEAYATISGLGCQWNDLVIAHASGVRTVLTDLPSPVGLESPYLYGSMSPGDTVDLVIAASITFERSSTPFSLCRSPHPLCQISKSP